MARSRSGTERLNTIAVLGVRACSDFLRSSTTLQKRAGWNHRARFDCPLPLPYAGVFEIAYANTNAAQVVTTPRDWLRPH